jgi:hypothetical protein
MNRFETFVAERRVEEGVLSLLSDTDRSRSLARHHRMLVYELLEKIMPYVKSSVSDDPLHRQKILRAEITVQPL